MQRRCHVANTRSADDAAAAAAAAASVLDWPLRPSCGWGLITLAPGAAEALTRNADSHILFRVLLGAVHVSLGDGRARPRVFVAGDGDMFEMGPGDFFGLHNAAPAAWAVLFCVHSLHHQGPGGAAAATVADAAAASTRATARPATDWAGTEDGAAGADGMPARKRRKCSSTERHRGLMNGERRWWRESEGEPGPQKKL
jgi:hypothetical protein